MALISDKVQRTISEQADSAVYAIKATVNFSNTDISNNDVFLSASTDSTVGIFNTTVLDINATGTIFQAVSSTIELFAVTIKRITYTLIAATQTSLQSSFYKITIVNNSFFRASNCTFDTIMGLLLYVSGSTMNLDSNTTISRAINDDANSALFAIDTSTVSIQNSNFSGIHSLYYSPIFNLQSNTLNAGQVSFTQFDKTLFALQQGSYSFSKTRIS